MDAAAFNPDAFFLNDDDDNEMSNSIDANIKATTLLRACQLEKELDRFKIMYEVAMADIMKLEQKLSGAEKKNHELVKINGALERKIKQQQATIEALRSKLPYRFNSKKRNRFREIQLQNLDDLTIDLARANRREIICKGWCRNNSQGDAAKYYSRAQFFIEMDGEGVINHKTHYKFQTGSVPPSVIRQFQLLQPALHRKSAAYANEGSTAEDFFNFCFAAMVAVNSEVKNYQKLFLGDCRLARVKDIVAEAVKPSRSTFTYNEFLSFIGLVVEEIQDFAPSYKQKMDEVWPFFSRSMARKVEEAKIE